MNRKEIYETMAGLPVMEVCSIHDGEEIVDLFPIGVSDLMVCMHDDYMEIGPAGEDKSEYAYEDIAEVLFSHGVLYVLYENADRYDKY